MSKLSRKQMISLGWTKALPRKKPKQGPLELTAEQLQQLVRDGWSEEEFQRQVILVARHLGWRVAHFRTVRIQRRDGTIYHATPAQADGEGFPDLVMHKGSMQVVMELKVGSNTITTEQQDWLISFSKIGAKAFCFYPHDWDQILSVLQAT